MEIKKPTSEKMFLLFCLAQLLVIWFLLWIRFGYEKPPNSPVKTESNLNLLCSRLNHPVNHIHVANEKDGNSDSDKLTDSSEHSTTLKPMLDYSKSPSQHPRQFCSCDKNQTFDRNEQNTNRSIVSTCSQEASDLGPGQRVISFSFYTNSQVESDYFYSGIELNLQESKILYPGWVTRIYTNVSVENPSICPIICKYPALFWCDIKNVPEMGDLSKLDERSWRFLPLGDPTVDIFISRDLDSRLTLRERVAIVEWETSNFTLHSMRDHPMHNIGMLGGMWGAKNSLLGSNLSKSLQTKLIAEARRYQRKDWDQQILNLYVYVPHHHLVLAHDSYSCGSYNDGQTLPFSVQRFSGELIGFRHPGNASTRDKCPVQCRPVYGSKWKYC